MFLFMYLSLSWLDDLEVILSETFLWLHALWTPLQHKHLKSSIIIWNFKFFFFTSACVTQCPISLENSLLATIIAFGWCWQWLVFLVSDFPLNLFEATLAKTIKRCLSYLFGFLTCWIELEFSFVLMLLGTFFVITFLRALHFFCNNLIIKSTSTKWSLPKMKKQ